MNKNKQNTFDVNVLGRDIDAETGLPYNANGIGLDKSGFDYWVRSLNHVHPSKCKTDYEVLLGFSESPENCGLFSEITGIRSKRMSELLKQLVIDAREKNHIQE